MKIIILTSKILFLALLALNLFFWVAAHAGGHNIPSNTNWSFGISSLVLLGLFLMLKFIENRKK
jgi:hypothetical protein